MEADPVKSLTASKEEDGRFWTTLARIPKRDLCWVRNRGSCRVSLIQRELSAHPHKFLAVSLARGGSSDCSADIQPLALWVRSGSGHDLLDWRNFIHIRRVSLHPSLPS